MPAIVELKDVSAGYHRSPVFTHLSLSIDEGAFAGIVGPTGSGKTTLLKTLLGTQKPHGGQVLIMGKPIKHSPAGSIGYVPQLETVDWTFPVTVEQVMLMGGYGGRNLWPWTSRKDKDKVRYLSEKLGIKECLTHHIRDISGGQQQRAFLGRALFNNPKLLVLDEPTSGIDIKTQHDVLHLLRDLNQEGMTILLTSHDLNAVAAHIPWVLCFNKGLLAQGRPEDVFTDAILSKTYNGDITVVKHQGHLLIGHNIFHKTIE